MEERYFCSMQMQAVGGMAIEGVAQDGTVESLQMGAMHPQLVRTPREGMQPHDGSAMVILPDDFVFRHRPFAMFEVHHLSGTVIEIWAQR